MRRIVDPHKRTKRPFVWSRNLTTLVRFGPTLPFVIYYYLRVRFGFNFAIYKCITMIF